MKYIRKKTISNLPKVNGSISDTINVEDEITNAPSIRLAKQLGLDSVPLEGVIYYEGEVIPDGYEEVEDPNIVTTQNTIIGAKLKMIDVNLTPTTYQNLTYLITTLPLGNTHILSIFSRNRQGYPLVPIQYFNVSSTTWVITDPQNTLSGSYPLTILYLEFENNINVGT